MPTLTVKPSAAEVALKFYTAEQKAVLFARFMLLCESITEPNGLWILAWPDKRWCHLDEFLGGPSLIVDSPLTDDFELIDAYSNVAAAFTNDDAARKLWRRDEHAQLFG